MSIIKTEQLSVWYDGKQALNSVCLDIEAHEILGIIGPANSGKTTFLRCLNRLHTVQKKIKISGNVFINGADIYDSRTDINLLRKKVGMVFALPITLPMSIFDDLAYGPRRQGISSKSVLAEIAERSLKEAYLWDEVKDRLQEQAGKLSGGQQQRLCIARTLAVEPDIILFDEPCSGLDPISTGKVEDAMTALKKRYTIILVTNNVKQASRVSDRTAFFLMGELIEINRTDIIFTVPKDKRTEDYVTGKFG